MSGGSFITTFEAVWNGSSSFGCGQRLLCAFSRHAPIVPVAVAALSSHVLRASQSTCAMPVTPIARANVGSSAVGGVASMVIVAAGALTWLARVAASLADRRQESESLVTDRVARLEIIGRRFVDRPNYLCRTINVESRSYLARWIDHYLQAPSHRSTYAAP